MFFIDLITKQRNNDFFCYRVNIVGITALWLREHFCSAFPFLLAMLFHTLFQHFSFSFASFQMCRTSKKSQHIQGVLRLRKINFDKVFDKDSRAICSKLLAHNRLDTTQKIAKFNRTFLALFRTSRNSFILLIND